MGETTYVRQNTAVQHKGKKRPLNLEVNALLVIATIALLVIGLLAVFSSSWEHSFVNDELNRSVFNTITSQVIFVVVGIPVVVFLIFFDYHFFQKWALPLMGVTLLILFVLVILHGGESSDPNRAFSGGSIQPSELAKLVIIIYLSAWLCSKKDQLSQFSLGMFPLMVIVGITALLIALQPDYSAAGTVVILGSMLFFLAGSNFRQIVLLLIIVSLIMVLAYVAIPTARQRFQIFINGLLDPEEAGYHAKRAMSAIGRGGLFGVGIGKGTSKYNEGVPVAWTDSIFVIIAEETGLIGALTVVLLYVILLWQGFKVAANAPDMFGQLLAAGITLWIGFEAFINIGGMMNLAPVAGNALPLISTGGSSLLTTMAALGILINISRDAKPRKKTSEGRSYSAVVSLRGRDRRGSVSRGRRASRNRR